MWLESQSFGDTGRTARLLYVPHKGTREPDEALTRMCLFFGLIAPVSHFSCGNRFRVPLTAERECEDGVSNIDVSN